MSALASSFSSCSAIVLGSAAKSHIIPAPIIGNMKRLFLIVAVGMMIWLAGA
jgi:hypothetical protein